VWGREMAATGVETVGRIFGNPRAGAASKRSDVKQ
jgi:hypothetical protein